MLINLKQIIRMANGREQLISDENPKVPKVALTIEEANDINTAIAKWSLPRKKGVVDFINSYLKQNMIDRPMEIKDVIITAINSAPGTTKRNLFVLNGLLNKVTEEAGEVDFSDKEIKMVIDSLNKIPEDIIHPVIAAQAYGVLDPLGAYLEPEEVGEFNTVAPEPVAAQ